MDGIRTVGEGIAAIDVALDELDKYDLAQWSVECCDVRGAIKDDADDEVEAEQHPAFDILEKLEDQLDNLGVSHQTLRDELLRLRRWLVDASLEVERRRLAG